eukprot:6263855-Lingulodinium_polyedra.AAC.1
MGNGRGRDHNATCEVQPHGLPTALRFVCERNRNKESRPFGLQQTTGRARAKNKWNAARRSGA